MEKYPIDKEKLMQEKDRIVFEKRTKRKMLAYRHKINEDYIYLIRNKGYITLKRLKRLEKVGFLWENIKA